MRAITAIMVSYWYLLNLCILRFDQRIYVLFKMVQAWGKIGSTVGIKCVLSAGPWHASVEEAGRLAWFKCFHVCMNCYLKSSCYLYF